MNVIIARLYADHRNMAELLEVLERQFRADGPCEGPDYALMLDIMRYATHYADLFHHPREDLVFDLLASRDAASHELVAAIEREHAVLAASGKRLFERLWAARDGIVSDSGDLESETVAYIAALRRHMTREEEELFPLAEAVLGDADRAGIEHAVPEREDPVFGHAVHHEYRVLRGGAARGQGD